jgi:hypothetical protein
VTSTLTAPGPDLTPELAEQLLRAAKSGVFKETAAEAVGIAPDLLDQWLRMGLSPGATEPYRTFARAYRAQEQGVQLEAIDAWRGAAAHDWKAAQPGSRPGTPTSGGSKRPATVSPETSSRPSPTWPRKRPWSNRCWTIPRPRWYACWPSVGLTWRPSSPVLNRSRDPAQAHAANAHRRHPRPEPYAPLRAAPDAPRDDGRAPGVRQARGCRTGRYATRVAPGYALAAATCEVAPDDVGPPPGLVGTACS